MTPWTALAMIAVPCLVGALFVDSLLLSIALSAAAIVLAGVGVVVPMTLSWRATRAQSAPALEDRPVLTDARVRASSEQKTD